MQSLLNHARLPIQNYDLDATLGSGQAFRWTRRGTIWEGVVAGRWVSIQSGGDGLDVSATGEVGDWNWLRHYLQTEVDLAEIIATFPKDDVLHHAVNQCCGLRLLRQEPWECLASFICSSTKQIVQIQQIIRALSERFGEPISVPNGGPPAFAFPTVERIAAAREAELRACKMGFRAPYLLGTARLVASGAVNLSDLTHQTEEQAREALLSLPGVGRKIADCVLLFAYGFPKAFPVDVWVMRALKELYFPKRRRVTLKKLQAFSATHFGPQAGYAQQYLFHSFRTRPRPHANQI